MQQQQQQHQQQQQSPKRSNLDGSADAGRSVAGRSRGPNGSACDRCRKRKIRCHGEKPKCQRCTRLGIDCAYPSPLDPEATSEYILELQSQVRELEALRESHRQSIRAQSVDTQDGHLTHSQSRRRTSGTPGAGVMGERNEDVQTTLRPVTTPKSVSHESVRGSVIPSTNPRFTVSTGPPQAESLRIASPLMEYSTHPVPDGDIVSPRYEAIQTTYPKPHDRPLPSNDQVLLDLPSDLQVTFFDRNSNQPPLLSTRNNCLVRIDPTVLPGSEQVNLLISHYETYTAAAFPIFHTTTLQEWVQKVCFKAEPVEPEIACAVLLVLAVSATSLGNGTTQDHLKLEAPALWEYGQKFLPPVFLPPIDEVRGLLRVQVMLIRLQYVLYNPNAGNVWGLSGAAVRASVDLGLHHESGLSGNNRSAIEIDLRRRVFWICDRDLGMALGRPPAIQDEWVSVEYPSVCDDSDITPSGILGDRASPSKLTAVHVFRIRRLQSEIIFTLYASGRRRRPSPEWMDEMQRSIEEWYAQRPKGTGFCSDEWLSLCYHQTSTLLHRPCPGNPQPPRESLVKALSGSSATMRLYKDIYRQGRSNFGWLSMYHLFISGVTYLNSLWQAYRNGWRLVPSYIDALLDMQVCTSVMEGLAALTPGATSIRNTWETVSEKMIRQLSSHARWDPLSRQPSPTSGGAASSQQRQQQGQRQDIDDQAFGADTPFRTGGLMGTENPFDSFLLHPLGEMSNDDWERAIASIGFAMPDSSYTQV